MDELNYPDEGAWTQRRELIGKMLTEAETWPSYAVSEHAVVLFMDMQLAYYAGAWLSVIIMSISVIDSHLRDTATLDTSLGTARLLKEYYNGEDIDWLRSLRNRYVHHNPDRPVFGMNDWWTKQGELELHATKAMQMTINALFQDGGT